MYDYSLGAIEDSDYKSELFEDFEFDWEDFELCREKEEIYNLMTLREAVEVLETWGQKYSELEKIAEKTVANLNKFIKQYEELGASS